MKSKIKFMKKYSAKDYPYAVGQFIKIGRKKRFLVSGFYGTKNAAMYAKQYYGKEATGVKVVKRR